MSSQCLVCAKHIYIEHLLTYYPYFLSCSKLNYKTISCGLICENLSPIKMNLFFLIFLYIYLINLTAASSYTYFKYTLINSLRSRCYFLKYTFALLKHVVKTKNRPKIFELSNIFDSRFSMVVLLRFIC